MVILLGERDMPALKPTDCMAEITWLGRVETAADDIRSTASQAFDTTFEGVAGESHYGVTRLSCVRVKTMHPEGTIIRNVRQFSILSEEEMRAIADEINLSELRPEWLGASMVIKGIGDFSHLPPSSRLQNEAGTTLVIDMQNRPCTWPAQEIEKDAPGHGKRFKPAAEGRRGVTAWIEREGPLAIGDKLRLHIPDQRGWTLMADHLSRPE